MSRIAQLEKFLEQQSQDAFLIHALALEHVKEDNLEAALTYFLKNKEHNPSYIATYFHLGKLYEKLSKTEQALEVYEQGMLVAQQAGDSKTYNEIFLAKDFLEDEMD